MSTSWFLIAFPVNYDIKDVVEISTYTQIHISVIVLYRAVYTTGHLSLKLVL